jgi:two-component system sensor histidine kinase/response regulator
VPTRFEQTQTGNLGTWSMHCIGMFAFSLSVPIHYDWPTVLLSLLAAVFASAVALFVVSGQPMRWFQAMMGAWSWAAES